MDFTSWDAGLHTIDNDYLAHYGIKGMKWGVRRFLNKNGQLTPAGEKRYGEKSTKKTGARKMQRHFNRLDQSYANVHANKVDAERAFESHMGKPKKQKKDMEQYGLYSDQAKGIESLQYRILGKAAQDKYDVTSRPIIRIGQSNKDCRRARAAGFVMGSVGVGAYAAANAFDKDKRIDGQQVKIRKNGTGKIQLVDYTEKDKHHKHYK